MRSGEVSSDGAGAGNAGVSDINTGKPAVPSLLMDGRPSFQVAVEGLEKAAKICAGALEWRDLHQETSTSSVHVSLFSLFDLTMFTFLHAQRYLYFAYRRRG